MIEIRHFKVLLAVVEAGTFSGAARAVHMTQPAVSRAVAQLEHHLGIELLDRTHQPVRLTDAGQRLLPAIRQAVGAFDAVTAAASDLHPPARRELRLGFGWLGCAEHDTQVIAAFEAQHPHWTVSVRCRDSHMAGLEDGSVDIAVLRCAPDPAHYHSTLLRHEDRIIALPAGHRLAHRYGIRLGELRGETLVGAIGTGDGIEFANRNLLLWRAHHPHNPIIAADNHKEWRNAIALGRGVGLVPAPAADDAHSGVRYLRLLDVDPVEVLLAWPATTPDSRCPEFITTALAHASPAPAPRPASTG